MSIQVTKRPTLGPEFEKVEEPNKTIPDALGPAGAALAKMDDLESILAAWIRFWESNPDQAGDALTTVEAALPILGQALTHAHRAFALLHMTMGGVEATNRVQAIFRETDHSNHDA